MKLFNIIAFSFISIGAFATKAQTEIEVGAVEEISTSATDYHHLNFGRVWVNTTHYARYVVTNTGNVPLTFESANIAGGIEFSATHSCSKGLQPGQKCWFEIRYWPAFEGFDSGRFILQFKEDTAIEVQLWGEAYRN